MLGGPSIGDDALSFLKQLPKLRDLGLAGSAVTDQGMSRLADVKTLRILSLNDAKVTDAGLVALAKLPLESLTVEGAKTTLEGRRKFRQARPNCHLVPKD